MRACVGAMLVVLAGYGPARAQFAVGPEDVSARHVAKCPHATLEVEWSVNRVRQSALLHELAIDDQRIDGELFDQFARAITPYHHIETFYVMCGAKPDWTPANFFVVQISGVHPESLNALDKCREKGGRFERSPMSVVVTKTNVEVSGKGIGTCWSDTARKVLELKSQNQ